MCFVAVLVFAYLHPQKQTKQDWENETFIFTPKTIVLIPET